MHQSYHDSIAAISKRRDTLRLWLVAYGGMMGASLGFIISTIRDLEHPSTNVGVALLLPLAGIFYTVSFLVAFYSFKSHLRRWRAASLAIRHIRFAGQCSQGVQQQANIDQANAALMDMYDQQHCDGLQVLKCHKCSSSDVKWSKGHERCFCQTCGTQIV